MVTHNTLTVAFQIQILAFLPSPQGLIPLSVFKVGEKSSALKMVEVFSYCNIIFLERQEVILQYE